jgi:hypothetical protein
MRRESTRERVPRRVGLIALVAATVAALPVRTAAAGDDACFPACRSGYLCHQGRCVSACNPPCGAGETCTAAGECVSAAPVPPPVRATLVGEAPVTLVGPAPAVDPGWARGAFYFGIAAAVVDVALTAAVVVTNPKEAALSRNWGALSIATFGVTAPLVALGGASARTNPGVTGHPRLRLASWVGYGLTLGGAAYLLLRSHRKVIDDNDILVVGALGTLSTVGFAIDAYASAAQAERLRTTGAAQPTLGFACGTGGAPVPTLGWAATF